MATRSLKEELEGVLKTTKICLDQDGSEMLDYLVSLSTTNEWQQHEMFLTYATRLDTSRLMYFIPEQFHALCLLTEEKISYVPARTADGLIEMYLVGICDHQKFGPFWNEDCENRFPAIRNGLLPRITCLFEFGRAVHFDLRNGIRSASWHESFEASYEYLTTHRHCVVRMGDVLKIDMYSHDLTKVRLLQVCFAWRFHFQGERKVDCKFDEELSKLADSNILQNHLMIENHHMNYEGELDINPKLLFADILSVHCQKNPPDSSGGWDINPIYVPKVFKDDWEAFKSKYQHLDLYELVWNPVQLEIKRKRLSPSGSKF